MPSTKKFEETVVSRMHAEPAFRHALLREGMETMPNGDVETGQIILNYSTLQRLSGLTVCASLPQNTGNAS